jgi:acetyl esterase/lipase
VRRVPLAGRLYSGRPPRDVTSVETPSGVLWRRASSANPFVIVLFSDDARGLSWLAGSLASRLDAFVVVGAGRGATAPAGSAEHAESARSAAVREAGTLGADVTRVGLLAEGAFAPHAIRAAGEPASHGGVTRRLALVSPVLDAAPEVGSLPPTLLQFARSGESAPVVELERQLRRTGVAVRAIDYTDVTDGWARYPRAARGSARGLDDLVAFFERGLGTQSTFDVIPGWDLH